MVAAVGVMEAHPHQTKWQKLTVEEVHPCRGGTFQLLIFFELKHLKYRHCIHG